MLPRFLLTPLLFSLCAVVLDSAWAEETALVVYERCVEYHRENYFKERGARQPDAHLDEEQSKRWKGEHGGQIGRRRCRPGYDSCRKNWTGKTCSKFRVEFPKTYTATKGTEEKPADVTVSRSIIPIIAEELDLPEEAEKNQVESQKPVPSPSPKGNADIIRELIRNNSK